MGIFEHPDILDLLRQDPVIDILLSLSGFYRPFDREWTLEYTKDFVSSCSLGTLKYLNISSCNLAASVGHLDILKWLREQGCPWNEYTCSGAAEGGHLEVLKWAKEQGCYWDEYTCGGAAEGGHLEVLKWVREQDCPWNEYTCSSAASNGHLEVLKWAREQGCP